MHDAKKRMFNVLMPITLMPITMTFLIASFSVRALAQPNAAVAVAMFDAAIKQPTSIAGVSIIADRPIGFNPLTASSFELGKYGLPQRPDSHANPKAFAHWTKAMQALQYRAADVKALPFSSTNLRMAKQSYTAAISGAPTPSLSYNWSGVANTNNLKAWNDVASFNYVQSIFNVPTAQPPFGACKAGVTGSVGVPGFYEVSWNGIDGFSNGDVLQGGSLSYADCGGRADNTYIGWVEWFPSYPVLQINCVKAKNVVPCPVKAGDQFFVITYGANAATQYVYLEDATQGWYGTFSLAYLNGPSLVGSSAEQVVERPCCDSDGYPVALTNFIADSFDYAWATNGKGETYGPGQQNSSTQVIGMVDDGATQTISTVNQGSAGFQGYYSLFFETDNCAYDGGCPSK
jgi:Peptidase A4 family